MKLISSQYSCCKIRVLKANLFEQYTSPSIPIFSGLRILTLYDLFQLRLLCFLYNCVNKTSPPHFHSVFHWLNPFTNMILGRQKNLTFS